MHFIQEHETEDLANARDSLEQVQGVGIMLLGRRDNGQFQIPQQLIIIVDQGEVDFDTLLHGGIREPLSNTAAVGFVGDLLANIGQIVLPIGLLDMRQQLSPFPHEMHPPPKQVAGGSHLRGIDVGLGQHATTQEHGNFLGVDLVIFGLAPVDGFHVERMPEDKRQPLPSAQVSKPIPGEDTFDADDQILPIGRNRLEKCVGSRWHIPVHEDLSILVQDAEVCT